MRSTHLFGISGQPRKSKSSLELGGRYDNRDVAAAPAAISDRSFGDFSASAGAVVRTGGESAVSVSLARAHKFPNGQELYSHGVHAATNAFEIGDPTLRPESSVGVDVSVEGSRGRLTGELALFAQDFDDFIFPDVAGAEIDGFPVAHYRQTDAEFRGGEVETSIEVFGTDRHHLDLKLFADYVRAEQTGRGQALPRIPPLGYGAGLHFHGERTHARLEWRRRDEQDRLATGETTTAGSTVVNASYSHRFIAGEQIYDVLLRGRNLTDAEVRVHTSFVKDQVPMPGRDVSLSLRLQF